MAYQVKDYRLKVAVPIGDGDTSAGLLSEGDIVPESVREQDIAWFLKRGMIEELQADVPAPDPDPEPEEPGEPEPEEPDSQAGDFNPLKEKAGAVIGHLKNSDDEEIARVIEIEKGASSPRSTIVNFGE